MMNDESAQAKFADTIASIVESQRDFGAKPRVAAQALPWVTEENNSPNPNGVAAIGGVSSDDSIPHITFIKFGFVFAQQRA